MTAVTDVANGAEIVEAARGAGGDTGQDAIRRWATNTQVMLGTGTAEELFRSSMRTIFEEYLGVPILSRFTGADMQARAMEAQARLLRFNRNLRLYLDGEISEEVYDRSKQALLESLEGVLSALP
jgi:hypothetical protein